MDEFTVSANDDFVNAGLDENDVWDGSSEPVPPGDYLVEVTKAERGTSKAGNAKIAVELSVVSRADGAATAAEGRKLFANYVEGGKAATKKRLTNFLVAAGQLENGGYRVSRFAGSRLIVTVQHEPYTKENVETGEVQTFTGTRVIKERRAS